MKLKDKIISVITIIAILAMVFVAYKSGIIDLKSRSSDGIKITDNTGKTSEQSGTAPRRDDTLDTMMFLHKGEKGVFESVIKNMPNSGNRFEFKFIDYGVSKDIPEGMVINFYIENEQYNSDGRFIDDTYYVTITYEVTNMRDDAWDSEGSNTFCPQNFIIGYYDDSGYKGKHEARGHSYAKAPQTSLSLNLDKGEKETVTTCYCVKKDFIDRGNVVVRAQAVENNNAEKIPYFILEFEENWDENIN